MRVQRVIAEGLLFRGSDLGFGVSEHQILLQGVEWLRIGVLVWLRGFGGLESVNPKP